MTQKIKKLLRTKLGTALGAPVWYYLVVLILGILAVMIFSAKNAPYKDVKYYFDTIQSFDENIPRSGIPAESVSIRGKLIVVEMQVLCIKAPCLPVHHFALQDINDENYSIGIYQVNPLAQKLEKGRVYVLKGKLNKEVDFGWKKVYVGTFEPEEVVKIFPRQDINPTVQQTGRSEYEIRNGQVHKMVVNGQGIVDYVALPIRDAQTFKVLYDGNVYKNNSYTSDKDGVYYGDVKIPEADRLTFSVLPSKYAYTQTVYEYGKDAYNVFHRTNKVLDASALSFTVLGYGYAIDNTNVYYAGKKLVEMDRSTFMVLDTPVQGNYLCDVVYVKDKNAVYMTMTNKLSRVENADPATFIFWGDAYGKDKNNIYKGLQVSTVSPDELNEHMASCREQGVW